MINVNTRMEDNIYKTNSGIRRLKDLKLNSQRDTPKEYMQDSHYPEYRLAKIEIITKKIQKII